MDSGVATAVSLGWLWFDDDPKTSLEEKVGQASARFRQKFGQPPRVCFVSQKALTETGASRWGPFKCGRASNVLPGHFLFVVEEQPVDRSRHCSLPVARAGLRDRAHAAAGVVRGSVRRPPQQVRRAEDGRRHPQRPSTAKIMAPAAQSLAVRASS
jgi:hypothetical protein